MRVRSLPKLAGKWRDKWLTLLNLATLHKNINRNIISGDWFGVILTWHYQQEHQWKQHQWRLIWCHTDLALPTRTSMETTSVETDLVSYWLGIINKNINGNNISGDWFGVILTWHYQQEHQWKQHQWRLVSYQLGINNNNVHLSCAHQRPERSHNTY